MKKDTQKIAKDLERYATELDALANPPCNTPPPPDVAGMERKRHQEFVESLKGRTGNKKTPSSNFKKWLLVSAPAAAVVILLFLLLPASDIHLASQAGGRVERGFDPTTLPQEMNLNLKKLSLTLANEDDRLEGALTPAPSESTPEEEVFRVVLTGLDRDKVKGDFTGRIRIARKVTAAPIKTKQDISKVIVEGDFRVGDQAAQPVSRAYQP